MQTIKMFNDQRLDRKVKAQALLSLMFHSVADFREL